MKLRRTLRLDHPASFRFPVLVVAVVSAMLVVSLARATVERPTQLQLKRMTWLQAVAIVDHHLGSGAWLRSCSRTGSEGGWGRWFWNGGTPLDDRARLRLLQLRGRPARPAGSSGVGGWLQFAPGTFDSVIRDAVRHARQHGLAVPPFARSWLHPLGQAVAGVEMLRDGRRHEWAGWAC